MAIPSLAQLRSTIADSIRQRLDPSLVPEASRSLVAAFTNSEAAVTRMLLQTIENAVSARFPSTSVGEFLSDNARIWGVPRQPATPATASVTFESSSAATYSADSPLVFTSSRSHQYTYVGEVHSGSNSVTIRATADGSASNLNTGEVLSSTIGNATVVVGNADGQDVESDTSLRRRLLSRLSSPFAGGSEADWVRWTSGAAGVTRVYVESPDAGVVQIFPVFDGSPTGVPTPDNISAVINHLEQFRPVGVDLQVTAFTPVVVDVSVSDVPQAQQAIATTALRDVIADSGELGVDFLPSTLFNALLAAGLQAPILTAPTAPITVGENALPILGTVTYG